MLDISLKRDIMGLLDFKEIPEAHISSGNQDMFELFGRDFLEYLGYRIQVDPGRGADGGKDIIVKEVRSGIGGETNVNWLVSCKHKAHSGSSVTPRDESNIRDRIEANNCDGFIGLYSTLPSSGLNELLNNMKNKIEVQIFDHEKIESRLLHSSNGIELSKRYFPQSIKRWQTDHPTPARVFDEQPSLKCKYCEKELLTHTENGIIILWYKRNKDYCNPDEKDVIEEIYWTCKGNCDRKLEREREDKPWVDTWEDISDIIIPVNFIRWIMVILNKLYSGTVFSEDAFLRIKEFLLNLFPFVTRDLSTEEKERIESLLRIPSWLGGLGE
jgi:hypothetical protein